MLMLSSRYFELTKAKRKESQRDKNVVEFKILLSVPNFVTDAFLFMSVYKCNINGKPVK